MAASSEFQYLVVLRRFARPERLVGIVLAGIINPAGAEHIYWDHILSSGTNVLGIEVRLRLFGADGAALLERRLARAQELDRIVSWKRVPPDWVQEMVPAIKLDQRRPRAADGNTP
jgi:hypothetical protein